MNQRTMAVAAKKDVIAIDGPAGAGKSTVAKLVARRLGYTYLDTGAMYRAATLQCLRQGVDLDNETEISRVVNRIILRFGVDSRIFMNDEDVSAAIRTIPVTANVSKVSSYKPVRDKMTEWQRTFCLQGKVVMEGRDIGTVVVPDAKYKFYLDASIENRAQRRLNEMGGEIIDYDKMIENIKRRDALDSTRKLAPLKKADDSVYLDTSALTVDQVVQRIIDAMSAGHA